MTTALPPVPPSRAPFRAPYAPPDEGLAAAFLAEARLAPEREERIDERARAMIAAIRKGGGGLGGVEDVLREYSLSTREGLALMVLAEALLRVPDAATADKLIEDKLGQGDFAHHEAKGSAFLVNASAWALGITARVIQPGETPESILGALAKRIGVPTVRAATRQAMRVMGSHFVLGETIGEALKRSASGAGKLYRYSFDMLGEGARTAADAARYQRSYADAIEAIGRAAGDAVLPDRPGISVKLSALHPRYEATSRERVLRELVPVTLDLARAAKAHQLTFTVDAEEADRLESSLDVIAAVAADPSLAGWDGFGLAIQAYQKRAGAVVQWVDGLAQALGRRFMVRLVKGAYWDTEIKRAQERGLADYPVYTRKAMTDLSYMAAASALLDARDRLYPQFATHNALTIAAIAERAGNRGGFEFQRLHGMGELAYGALREREPAIPCRTYAPVGGHKDLLAYLVRRLLENGANSSFVNVAGDPAVPVADLLRRPADVIGASGRARHSRIPLPAALYTDRRNAAGVEFGHQESLDGLLAEIAGAARPVSATPVLLAATRRGAARDVLSPIDGRTVAGTVVEATPDEASAAVAAAHAARLEVMAVPVERRASALEHAADAMERERGLLLHLMRTEAGKTLDDAVAELREAVDFLRYYAVEARKTFGAPERMPGPTGEENTLRHRPRGVFVCISPWNFPLAIFAGQVAAALAAGNPVVAKPAGQTPLIAFEAVRLFHAAGFSRAALQLAPGGGEVGAALVTHPAVAGVAFTGSTATAWRINRALAAKDGPIVPLIAETGGINAMIVDATALPEQVADDVVTSAFRSAGQRCSALRLLCLQEDIADKVVEMVEGAARELTVGDPRAVETHVGPVIDRDAKDRLLAAVGKRAAGVKLAVPAPDGALSGGTYVGPHLIELTSASELAEEVFGPVLHVVRWKAGGLPKLLGEIDANGYGLTLGVESRIDGTVREVIDRLSTGNVYVNRNLIGAVVGTQPFGGSALSGTGPKAGGPNYLKRFALEQVVSVNTAAAGGNAALIGMGEE